VKGCIINLAILAIIMLVLMAVGVEFLLAQTFLR
jgi:hypothetical protein